MAFSYRLTTLTGLKAMCRTREQAVELSVGTPESSKASPTEKKGLKRMAYGFRDDDYFFLRIPAAFPSIP